MNSRNLTSEAFEFLSKSDEERISYCKQDHWIAYPAANKLIELLEDKFSDPPQMRHEGLLIYGDSNNGKTAILKKMYRLHNANLGYVKYDKESIYEIPIIYFQAPTIPDESRLYSLILNELFVPHKLTEKIIEKSKLVERHLKKLNTRMILIDEIHSALTGNLNKQRTFINDLKQLSNNLSLTIVLAGTKEAYSALSIGSETESRFPAIELPRWSNDKKFRSFIATYERCLPLKEASNMADDAEIISALFHKSEGLIGKTVNLLKKAAVKAIKSKREKIIVSDIEYLPKL
ncbi:TniB family NTP-binding protein [Campylobacter sp. CCUG 57310]|uniref:TniB family NTP-binding protein n=1 Tax=Campylobacter sp. CCUG 57310 TaxID=2517362 RepID=UPI001564E613|nr:TniB family NTP-binding protein [Campylobacter sp. CCUG 57310]QKF91621.1 transposition-related ATP-binding protein TniB [Campylobacter sp. CCUG 57310]